MMHRLTVFSLVAATVWPVIASAATELNTRRSITVNEAPPVALQPAEASPAQPDAPSPVPVPPQPLSAIPRVLGAPPQPVSIESPVQAAPALPPDAPFKSGQPETAAAAPPPVAEDEAAVKPSSVFDEPAPPQPTNVVMLQGLNKVTGHISKIDTPFNVAQRFGNLEITAKRCWKSAPEERPEDAVLLEIRELQVGEASKRIFLGWMFSSSPGLSGLEHPVYDVNLLSCEFRPDVALKPEEKPAPAEKPKTKDKPKKESKPKEPKIKDKPAARPEAKKPAKADAASPGESSPRNQPTASGPQVIKIP